jgi:hypothetical protein
METLGAAAGSAGVLSASAAASSGGVTLVDVMLGDVTFSAGAETSAEAAV